MNCKFEFDSGTGVLLMTVYDAVDDVVLPAVYQALLRTAQAVGAKSAITDCSYIQSIQVSPVAVRRLAYHNANYLDGLPRCLVIPQRRIYGLSRIYQMMGGSRFQVLHIVRSVEDAYARLQVSQPQYHVLEFDEAGNLRAGGPE